jgi:imidazolonepropionase-like amidohydrolase
VKVTQTGGHGGVDRGRGFTRDELSALVEAAHQRGAKVRSHCVWTDDIKELVQLGVDVIDHGDGLDDEGIDLMVEHGTTWIPSLALSKLMLDGANGMRVQVAGVAEDYERLKKILPRANDAGVRIVPGDDYGAPMLPHVPGIYAKELAIYVEDFGISESDVIRWATRNGGEMMGQHVGVVEENALADLIVVDGDPLADIHILSDAARITLVMVDGKIVKDTRRTGAAHAKADQEDG